MSDSINSNNAENYGKFNRTDDSHLGEGSTTEARYRPTQTKYAFSGLDPINCDPSRMTEDDKAAYTEMKSGEPANNHDESQRY